MIKKYSLFILSIILIDQLSKRLFQKIGLWKLNEYFFLESAWNTGVSFSLLADMNPLLLTIITFALSCYVCFLLFYSKRVLEQIGLSLIVGGAIGNLLDRMIFGKVFDFIVIQYQLWRFPTFNFADICISIGGIVLFYDVFLKPDNKKVNKSKITK